MPATDVLKGTFTAASFVVRNGTPIGKNGRILWSIGGAVALGGIALAPVDAFAKAATTLSGGTGTFDFLKTTGSLIGEGFGVGTNIATEVGGELPDMYARALKVAAAEMH
jgi:hypothetical protein